MQTAVRIADPDGRLDVRGTPDAHAPLGATPLKATAGAALTLPAVAPAPTWYAVGVVTQ